MKATQTLNEPGQSIRLDDITREMLDSGQLQTSEDLMAHIEEQGAALGAVTARERPR